MSIIKKTIYLPSYLVYVLKLKFHGIKYGKYTRGKAVHFYNEGEIVLGNKVKLNSYPDGLLLLTGIQTYTKSAKVYIGDECILNGTMIYCRNSVLIGKYCMFGPGTKIVDNDSHKVVASMVERRNPPISKPIVIQDNVWIGMDCLILKGVTIGENSIIAARTVITKDVPPNVLVGGNPVRIIKRLT